MNGIFDLRVCNSASISVVMISETTGGTKTQQLFAHFALFNNFKISILWYKLVNIRHGLSTHSKLLLNHKDFFTGIKVRTQKMKNNAR